MYYENILQPEVSMDMTRKKKDQALIIEYKELGTISIDELIHALMEDLNSIKEDLRVRFVSGVRIRIPVTNEYGEPLRILSETGATVNKINTCHYRPSCLDYDL